jgi:hypothetical protein
MHRDLSVFWRNAHPGLKELDLVTFTHMRVCCPQCGGAAKSCRWCNETGLCCPRCNGAGWLAHQRQGEASEMVRCTTCYIDMSEGAQYDPANAMRAIDRYLEDWFDGVLPDEVLEHREEVEREAAARKAYQEATPRLWKHG